MAEKKLGPGQQFGQWTLTGDLPLGRGGNGAVWKATNPHGAIAALKFLHKNQFLTARWERFRDEVRFMLAESGREGILPLLDHYLPERPDIEDRPWFAMPLAIPFTRVQLSGSANLTQLVSRIELISRALAVFHAENKSHRDIKPDNLFEQDGRFVLGDWGLVDFPEKGAVTASDEIMGPLFYVAPEMMHNAADVPGQPADVYSLAKTLWVLASGQRFPPPGHQRMEEPGVRLSTYCPHPRARQLDVLIERCTSINPADRPAASAVAEELAAWQKTPQPENLAIDVEALTKEFSGIFEPGNRAEQRRQELLNETQGLLSLFEAAFHQVERLVISTTGIPTEIGEIYDLPPAFEFTETMESPSVDWRGAHGVEVSHGDFHQVRLQSFVQVELLSDENVRIIAGHLLRYEVGKARTLLDLKEIGCLETKAPIRSAQLENELQELYTGIIKSTPDAIRAFADQVKGVGN